jgi:uncharacterized protein (DUF924 family)
VHTQAVALFTQLGNQDNLNFELRHQGIIDRFGRYPHRNAILGRSSGAEELAFLGEPGSSFWSFVLWVLRHWQQPVRARCAWRPI